MNTQQAYLLAASRAIVKDYGFKLDAESIVYSYGFPKGRGKAKVIGQCWSAPKPSGHNGFIVVHPCQWKTPLDVLHVLLHELIHAETPGAGHKGEFVKLARASGLVGPPTATTAGPECAMRLNKLAEGLGEFPKADFDLSALKKPSTGSRLRLWECSCGVKARVASDDFAAECGLCGSEFEKVEK